jgi:hypothetical protein
MLDCGVCLLDWYRIWRRLSPPLTHACIAQSPHENERLGFLNSSAPQLQLSRVRSSTSLGLAQDVDVQLSTSQYSITHPACCQPAMGTWAPGLRSRLFLTLPLPAGVVGFDVSLHCMRACMDPRLERISPSIPSPTVRYSHSHSHSKSGLLASCTACFMSSLQALLVCLPRTSRGISRFPLPRRVLVGEVAASAIQCISPIGTAPD